MPRQDLERLRSIKTLPSLIKYLRDELGWPVEADDPEEATFEYTPEELGIDPASAAKIKEIRQLRPLTTDQPWGIFWINFEPKRLPIVVLRRLLSGLAIKRRMTGKHRTHRAWHLDDLLFISAYGEEGDRAITFAHFSQNLENLPLLKVLGWDDQDTVLHLDYAHQMLVDKLSWSSTYLTDIDTWRQTWSDAFELRHREVIDTSRELAVRLAEFARRIRRRVSQILRYESEEGPFHILYKEFQETLIHDLSEDDFADICAQSVTYGLLSARITDPKAKASEGYSFHMQTNPLLGGLLNSLLRVGKRNVRANRLSIDFDELGINELTSLLNDSNTNIEAVVRDFDDKNPKEDPVIRFYELFLKEYDAAKRMQRGVFYTPRPVVSYIVGSVDNLLRTEFGLEDGLADTTTWGEMARVHKELEIPDGIPADQDFIQILDPAVGTGTFLVEIIDLIHDTMVAKWNKQGHHNERIEALWNDYVSGHLLPRLHGYELLMAPYAIAHLKIEIKLLATGYKFSGEERARIFLTNSLEAPITKQYRMDRLPALALEAESVNEIKHKQRFTVVIGNPPYSNYGRANVNPWITSLVDDFWGNLEGETKVNLYDDYIKFLRLAFYHREKAGACIVGMITNRSYLDAPTQRQMRAYMLKESRTVGILDLYRGIYGAEKAIDKNVFAITTGVAISIWSHCPWQAERSLRFGRLIGTYELKADLLSLSKYPELLDTVIEPRSPYFFLIPTETGNLEYSTSPAIPDLFNTSTTGVQTNRDALCLDESPDRLLRRISEFAQSAASARAIAESLGIPNTDYWNATDASKQLRENGVTSKKIHRYLYRPFDWRYIYYDDSIVHCPRKLISESVIGKNVPCLLVSRGVDNPLNGVALVSNTAADNRVLGSARGGSAKVFPISAGNVEGIFRDQPSQLNIRSPQSTYKRDNEMSDYSLLSAWYALLYSPTYLQRNAGSLRLDYPRIPQIGNPSLFSALSKLGQELIDLHLMNFPGQIKPITSYSGPAKPEVIQVGWSDGTVWLDAGVKKNGKIVSPGTMGFRGVSDEIWNLHIGGYQVCEKWLKDRKGRRLSVADISHYEKIVAIFAGTIRLMREIDDAIKKHGGWPGAFFSGKRT